MRLIHTRTLVLHEFNESSLPPYAILSHTWQDDEVTFQEMLFGNAIHKAGYAKITSSCYQAISEDLDYIWIDTCCIDKSSSAELSEAINSMYRWYGNSEVCYAFLADVDMDQGKPGARWEAFAKSRWFTRGWTLAPKNVHFFSKDWKLIGNKGNLHDLVSKITKIDLTFFHGRDVLSASVAERMSWVSMRETTRTEDLAYSLLGIFDVNMALLYGEGEKSFRRLQEEILKYSDDQTIFAWGLPRTETEADSSDEGNNKESSNQSRLGSPARHLVGLLARSPKQFANSHDIACNREWQIIEPYSMTNSGLRITMRIKDEPKGYDENFYEDDVMAFIGAQRVHRDRWFDLAIHLTPAIWSDRSDPGFPYQHMRVEPAGLKVLHTSIKPERQVALYIKQKPHDMSDPIEHLARFRFRALGYGCMYQVANVFPPRYWSEVDGCTIICRSLKVPHGGAIIALNHEPGKICVLVASTHVAKEQGKYEGESTEVLDSPYVFVSFDSMEGAALRWMPAGADLEEIYCNWEHACKMANLVPFSFPLREEVTGKNRQFFTISLERGFNTWVVDLPSI